MSRRQYEKEAIAELAAEIKEEGLRVFLAESGTYGFFTNEKGDRLVSFGLSLGVITYSSNYARSRTDYLAGSRYHGKGAKLYSLANDNHRSLLNRPMPYLIAEDGLPMRYTKLDEYLACYDKYSRFTEI